MGDLGSISGLGRSPGEGKGYPLQYSGLENSMDCIVRGILKARILEWVAFPFSRGSSQPRDWTQVSHIAGGFFTNWAIREGLMSLANFNKPLQLCKPWSLRMLHNSLEFSRMLNINLIHNTYKYWSLLLTLITSSSNYSMHKQIFLPLKLAKSWNQPDDLQWGMWYFMYIN